MKKLFIIFIILIGVSLSLSAKNKDINLNTSIAETNVTYNLYYANDTIEDGTTNYEIYTYGSLNRNGNTNYFRIHASSNMNKGLSVDLNVKPSSFKTTLNNENDIYDSDITPIVYTPYMLKTLPAGKNKNTLVSAFILYWQGKSDLPAGRYVSNVIIEYSIS